MGEILTDGELSGSPIAATDLPQLALVLCHPEVGQTLGGARSYDEVVAIFAHWRDVWEQSDFGPFLFRDNDGSLIGYSGLMPAPIGEADDVELLYASLPECWGHGITTRTSRLVLDWAFRNRDFHSVVAYTLTDNHASMGVMKKRGFVFERSVVKAGLPHVFYRLTRAGWESGGSN